MTDQIHETRWFSCFIDHGYDYKVPVYMNKKAVAEQHGLQDVTYVRPSDGPEYARVMREGRVIAALVEGETFALVAVPPHAWVEWRARQIALASVAAVIEEKLLVLEGQGHGFTSDDDGEPQERQAKEAAEFYEKELGRALMLT